MVVFTPRTRMRRLWVVTEYSVPVSKREARRLSWLEALVDSLNALRQHSTTLNDTRLDEVYAWVT